MAGLQCDAEPFPERISLEGMRLSLPNVSTFCTREIFFVSQADKRLWDLKTSLLQRQTPTQAYSAYKLSPNAPHCGKPAAFVLYFPCVCAACFRAPDMRVQALAQNEVPLVTNIAPFVVLMFDLNLLFKGDWPSRFSWGINKSVWLGLVKKVRPMCWPMT